MFLEVSVIFLDSFCIDSSENLNLFDILILNQLDLNIVIRGEKSKIKVLEQVLFQILVFCGTKIVKSFDFVQLLASFWVEFVWNADDRGVDITLLGHLIHKSMRICNWVITNISQHQNSVLDATLFRVVFVVKIC